MPPLAHPALRPARLPGARIDVRRTGVLPPQSQASGASKEPYAVDCRAARSGRVVHSRRCGLLIRSAASRWTSKGGRSCWAAWRELNGSAMMPTATRAPCRSSRRSRCIRRDHAHDPEAPRRPGRAPAADRRQRGADGLLDGGHRGARRRAPTDPDEPENARSSRPGHPAPPMLPAGSEGGGSKTVCGDGGSGVNARGLA